MKRLAFLLVVTLSVGAAPQAPDAYDLATDFAAPTSGELTRMRPHGRPAYSARVSAT